MTEFTVACEDCDYARSASSLGEQVRVAHDAKRHARSHGHLVSWSNVVVEHGTYNGLEKHQTIGDARAMVTAEVQG